MAYTVQVAPEDCTGCTLCVEVCPAKDKTQVGRKALNMAPQPPLRETESKNWDFFMKIPDLDRKLINPSTIKNSQLLRPLFEFSGACSGCGETPYVKLVSQLFGDRADRRKCHRLLIHLRRQSAHHPLGCGYQRTRPGLVELAV